jgi:site-specific recombinase XerC
MAQQLTELVGQFCNFQRKQRGKTEGGVKTYRWMLEQFLIFVRNSEGRLARVSDLTASTIQCWMDDMAGTDLALSTMRSRQSALSSFCGWLVKRGVLSANPVAQMDRPPHRPKAPEQVPGSAIMDALVEAAKQRKRPRDVAVFLILRYSGMRRESVCHPAGASPRWAVGVAKRVGQGRQETGCPPPLSSYGVSARVCGAGAGQTGREGRPGHATVLVDVGAPDRWKDAGADDGEEHLAPLQGVRSAHWLPDAETA